MCRAIIVKHEGKCYKSASLSPEVRMDKHKRHLKIDTIDL